MNEQDLIDWYFRNTKKVLNLKNPQTLNEKIQWLKLYDSIPLKTRLADKYLVRDWVKENIGEEYLIPLINVFKDVNDINFNSLPEKCILKCNHASGWNKILDKTKGYNIEEIKSLFNTWMSKNFSETELHYTIIPRRIVVEKFLNEINSALYDYRFFCCNGKVEQIWLDKDSGTPNHTRLILDKNWNKLNFKATWPLLTDEVEKPKKLREMIEIAETLSSQFCFVRVDLYYVNDKIYFGEMTFTPMNGKCEFDPEEEGLKLGQKIKLPELAYNFETKEFFKWNE